MKLSTEILASRPFVQRGLHASVPPFEPGQLTVELTPDSAHFEPDGCTIGPAAISAAMHVAAELALNEAAPAGAKWLITNSQCSFTAPAGYQTRVKADLNGLDWKTAGPQGFVANVLSGTGTVAVATARFTVVVIPPC
jgi:acyl-coenzyme A thioesterase PaaI-like protein